MTFIRRRLRQVQVGGPGSVQLQAGGEVRLGSPDEPDTRVTGRITDKTGGHGDENKISVGVDRGRVTVNGSVSLTTGSAALLLKDIGVAIACAARWKAERGRDGG